MSKTFEEELEGILESFEEDFSLITTYNTLERQQSSRAVSHKLAKSAIIAAHQAEIAIVEADLAWCIGKLEGLGYPDQRIAEHQRDRCKAMKEEK